MNKKLHILVIVLVIACLVLAACQPKTSPTEAAKPAEATAKPTEPPAAGKVQIRWFVGLGTGTDAPQQEIQQQVVEEFNASHANIELILEVVPYDSARDTLATQIASGNGPDLVGPVGWSGSNAFYGQWLDLSAQIKETGYDTTQFSETLVKFYQTEEGQVGLPFAVFPAAVFYQKEMFDEAGLNYPPAKYGEKYKWADGSEEEWSYDTLTKIAKELTVDVNGKSAVEEGFDKNRIVQYGYVPQYQHPNHMGALWGADKLYTEEGGKVTAVIPENWAASWKWYFEGIWGDQPFIPNYAVVESPEYDTGNPFNGGKVAMAITHMWYTCCIGNAGESWDLAVLPSYQGTVHGRVDADTFRVWKGTKHPKEAFEVLNYLIGPASLKLLETYGGMPARTADLDAFFKIQAEQYPWVVNWEVMKAGLEYTDVPSAEGYMPNWNEGWNRVEIFGNLLANDGTIDFQVELDKLLSDLQVIFEKKP